MSADNVLPEVPSGQPASPPTTAVGLDSYNLAETLGTVPEEQFLQISIGESAGEVVPLLLPVAELAEIMKLSVGQVMPMFQMAPWVMGVYNWRGDMLWIADLGHFLGFAPWYRQAATTAEHAVVVIKPPLGEGLTVDTPLPTLGLLVGAIQDMVTYPAETLLPISDPAAVAPSLQPFLTARCSPQGEGCPWILDGTALLKAMAQAQAETQSSLGLVHPEQVPPGAGFS